MENTDNFLTVSQVAQRLNVSEETVRRWIRSKSLNASRSGREFLISKWHLENFIITGGKPLYEDSDLLGRCSLGFHPAFFGSSLFDQAYFKVEIQWKRIEEDRISFERESERQRQEIRKMQTKIEEWNKKRENAQNSFNPSLLDERPPINQISNNWILPMRTLFVDIHFYFVAAEGIGKSIKKLNKDISEPAFLKIIDKYSPILKDINEIRRHLEHIDERIIHPEYNRDLGNMDEKGFRFGNKYFDFYISDIRKLRDELCDFFLNKTLPEKGGFD